MKKLSESHAWKGGVHYSYGYRMIRAPLHPRTKEGVYVWEHLLIAEKALGRLLPAGAEIHHVNEIRDDNRNSNLVICDSSAYHKLLHRRLRAYQATGSVHGVKCKICRKWSLPGEDPEMFTHGIKRIETYHRTCQREHRQRMRRKGKP